jgi:hypothetical protein
MVYEFFKRHYRKQRAVIKAKTYDNPFCQRGYIETLKKPTTAQVDAYLNGEFVNINSASVYTGTIAKHTAPTQTL